MRQTTGTRKSPGEKIVKDINQIHKLVNTGLSQLIVVSVLKYQSEHCWH
jgi:hypothetical protein